MSRLLFLCVLVAFVSSTLAQQDCESNSDCTSCLSESGCKFCPDDSSCIKIAPRCRSGSPIRQIKKCPEPVVDSCPSFTDCDACIAGGCGWCSSSKSDHSNGKCSKAEGEGGCDNDLWFTGTCPVPPPENKCATHPDCQSCSEESGCGWCSETDNTKCYESTEENKPKNNECAAEKFSTVCVVTPEEDPCDKETMKSCETCSKHEKCGWCKEDSKCVQKGLLGKPKTPQDCKPKEFVSNPDKCVETPKKECNKHILCSGCLRETGCGWCNNNKKCVEAFGKIPVFKGQCTADEFSTESCPTDGPPPVEAACETSKTCDSCNSNTAGCGWCNTTGSCNKAANSNSCTSWFKGSCPAVVTQPTQPTQPTEPTQPEKGKETTSDSSSGGKSGLSNTVIGGIVAGSVVGLLFIVFIIYRACKKKPEATSSYAELK